MSSPTDRGDDVDRLSLYAPKWARDLARAERGEPAAILSDTDTSDTDTSDIDTEAGDQSPDSSRAVDHSRSGEGAVVEEARAPQSLDAAIAKQPRGRVLVPLGIFRGL